MSDAATDYAIALQRIIESVQGRHRLDGEYAAHARKHAAWHLLMGEQALNREDRTESIACGFAFDAGQQLGELQREVHRCWCDRGYSGSCGCSNRIGDLLYDFGGPKCWLASHEGPDGTIPWPCPECAAGDAP